MNSSGPDTLLDDLLDNLQRRLAAGGGAFIPVHPEPLAALVAVAVWQAGSLLAGVYVSVGLLAVAGVLAGAGWVLVAALLLAVVGGLLFAISTKYGFDARIIRGKGAPYTTVDRGRIVNAL